MTRFTNLPPILNLFLMFVCFVFQTVSASNLKWEAVPDDDLAGYVIYRGTESGNYTAVIDVGDVQQYSMTDLQEGVAYFLSVVSYDAWGNESDKSDEINYTVNDISTGVDFEDTAGQPLEFSLGSNYPNPFNPETNIGYSVEESGNFSLSIYNIKGEKIKVLIDRMPSAAGERNEICWDSRDDHGSAVSSGVYFYILQQGRKIETRRMILVR